MELYQQQPTCLTTEFVKLEQENQWLLLNDLQQLSLEKTEKTEEYEELIFVNLPTTKSIRIRILYHP